MFRYAINVLEEQELQLLEEDELLEHEELQLLEHEEDEQLLEEDELVKFDFKPSLFVLRFFVNVVIMELSKVS